MKMYQDFSRLLQKKHKKNKLFQDISRLLSIKKWTDRRRVFTVSFSVFYKTDQDISRQIKTNKKNVFILFF